MCRFEGSENVRNSDDTKSQNTLTLPPFFNVETPAEKPIEQQDTKKDSTEKIIDQDIPNSNGAFEQVPTTVENIEKVENTAANIEKKSEVSLNSASLENAPIVVKVDKTLEVEVITDSNIATTESALEKDEKISVDITPEHNLPTAEIADELLTSSQVIPKIEINSQLVDENETRLHFTEENKDFSFEAQHGKL